MGTVTLRRLLTFACALEVTRSPALSAAQHTAGLSSVEVLGTNHPTQGNTGKFFFFDMNAWCAMTGIDPRPDEEDVPWDDRDVVQTSEGRQVWNGTVRVWANQFGIMMGHGG